VDDPAPEIRLSDTERDVVITHLREASAEGRITLDEFGERTRLAYQAQFASEIEHLTRDLPAIVEPAGVAKAAAPALAANAGEHRRRWFVQVMGGATRSGQFDPGDSTVSITLMGGQDIDLTQIDAERVVITALTVMGGTDIIVPDGCTLDLGGFMLFGSVENQTKASGDSKMHVTVRAYGAMGACEVRNLKDKERAKRA